MMHTKRRWSVAAVATAEELAEKLTQRTWTLCAGFVVEGHPMYVFLNDSTHEDGAGEWAVVKVIGPWSWVQIESITFSWASMEQALGHVEAALRGDYDVSDFVKPVNLRGRLDPSDRHRCPLCA